MPVIISCQSTSEYGTSLAIAPSSLYLDNAFPKPANLIIQTEQEIFMIDDAMKSMVKANLNITHNTKKKAKSLLSQIFAKDNMAINYASNANLTAREAYHSHVANCMSLTIMAYALAKEANLDVDFQQVDVPEYWIRNGQYNLLTGHVNLLIKPSDKLNRNIIYGNDNIQIDFDPYVTRQTFSKRIIEKNTVLAMFYNNKGGQALVKEQFNIAYQYFRAAVEADDKFSPAWGNLAVLYRLTNNLELAEKTYRYTITIDPKNLTALTNLAILLRNQHNDVEAEGIENMLFNYRKKNPYYYAVLADEAFYKQDFSKSVKLYKRAIRLNNKIHELYYGMAKAYYQMNRLSDAKRAMKKALSLNMNKSTEYQYIAKLNFLKAEVTN